MYRVSGIAAFVLVVGYFLTFPIYFWVGDQPASGVEAQLAYFAEHAGRMVGHRLSHGVHGPAAGADLLRDLPGPEARQQRADAGGARLQGLPLRHPGPGGHLDGLLDDHHCRRQYGAAATEAQRAALAAAAAYPSAMLVSPLSGMYAILIPSLGVLFAGLVMLKGVFNKATAYVALAVGLTGILCMGSYYHRRPGCAPLHQRPPGDGLLLACGLPALQAR